MPHPFAEQVYAATTTAFTEAVDASFLPVSRLGGPGLLSMYEQHSDQLPFDGNEGHETPPDLDIPTVAALNALHYLTKSTRETLSGLAPGLPEEDIKEDILVTAAAVIAVNEVVKTQQRLAASTAGRYHDTSLLGQ